MVRIESAPTAVLRADPSHKHAKFIFNWFQELSQCRPRRARAKLTSSNSSRVEARCRRVFFLFDSYLRNGTVD